MVWRSKARAQSSRLLIGISLAAFIFSFNRFYYDPEGGIPKESFASSSKLQREPHLTDENTGSSLWRSFRLPKDSCSGQEFSNVDPFMNMTLINEFARRRTYAAKSVVEEARILLNEGFDIQHGTQSIPALGIPFLIDTEDFLLRLLQSIDFPVDKLILIHNGIDEEAAKIVSRARDIRQDIILVRFPVQIGVASSWNEIIMRSADKPWWLISNYDMAFPPGALKQIWQATNAKIKEESCTVYLS